MRIRNTALAAVAALAVGLFAGTGLVSATPGEQNGDSLSVTQPMGGAYVHVTALAPGRLDFNFGWNNTKSFTSEPVGYWIGVYDNDCPCYVWATDNPLVEPSGKLKLTSIDETTLISGHSYTINFFIRGSYGPPAVTNVAVVQVTLTAP